MNDATLTITSVQYYSKNKNHAPVWNGAPKTITLHGPTTIDFSPYFSDPDGNDLVYLASVPEGIHATASGSTVTLTPEQNTAAGTATLTLVVSDLQYSVRANIPLEIISSQ